MSDIIIIGAGGHAAEIDEYIRYSHEISWKKEKRIIGFLDDNEANYRRYKLSAPLLGDIKTHEIRKNCEYIIAIANLQNRRSIVDKYKAEGAQFSSFVDCRAYVSGTAVIGEGSIIGPYVNVGPNVRIGIFSLINSRASMGHDTTIGDFNIISPNVCFSGFTDIGNENLFGINSATVPGIKVGSFNKIAAGMILDQNVGDNTVVFHRFKEKIIAIPKTKE
jgi:sugar O-acyltransferase (sialic acid O-acetyltransferase NeuD family)